MGKLDANHCRREAEECRQEAAKADPRDRSFWLQLAAEWERLAGDDLDGRTNLGSKKSPSPRREGH
jgi:hypothetical protein